jgi:hypothetical protein
LERGLLRRTNSGDIMWEASLNTFHVYLRVPFLLEVEWIVSVNTGNTCLPWGCQVADSARHFLSVVLGTLWSRLCLHFPDRKDESQGRQEEVWLPKCLILCQVLCQASPSPRIHEALSFAPSSM